MGDDLPCDERGELAWVRVELDLLGSAGPLPPSKRARFEELVRRERLLLGLDEPATVR
jgi:hypothetical protein